MSMDCTGFPTGTRRLRRGRRSLPNQVYHVTTASYSRRDIFRDFACGRAVVAAIQRESAIGEFRTMCFCVMPDHLHWLVQNAGRGSLSEIVRKVKARASWRIHHLGLAEGRIWQSGFHDHALRRDESIIVVARYIVANPLRAGLVTRVGDWPLWDAAWL